MSTFLVNHLLHESERLSLADQMRLARLLLDRIRQESLSGRLKTGGTHLDNNLQGTESARRVSKN